MFDALERGRPFTLNELSQETGIHSITLKRYIRLVRLVRQEPELEVIRTRHSVIIRMLGMQKAGPRSKARAGQRGSQDI
jgi:hypothetical protein